EGVARLAGGGAVARRSGLGSRRRSIASTGSTNRKIAQMAMAQGVRPRTSRRRATALLGLGSGTNRGGEGTSQTDWRGSPRFPEGLVLRRGPDRPDHAHGLHAAREPPGPKKQARAIGVAVELLGIECRDESINTIAEARR